MVAVWLAHLDRPSAQIHCHGRVSCSPRQIGHQQLGLFGAIVTPPPTEHYGDISDLPQLRTLGKGPEDPVSGAGDKQGDTDLAVGVNRQMGDHIAQVLTVGQLPGAWKGDDKEGSVAKFKIKTSEIITLCDLCSQGVELLCRRL